MPWARPWASIMPWAGHEAANFRASTRTSTSTTSRKPSQYPPDSRATVQQGGLQYEYSYRYRTARLLNGEVLVRYEYSYCKDFFKSDTVPVQYSYRYRISRFANR